MNTEKIVCCTLSKIIVAAFKDRIFKYLAQNGGKGSGNFHHAGRKGQVGGSQKYKYSYDAQKEFVKSLLDIDESEFMNTVSEMNTLYDRKYKDFKNITHYTPAFIYYAENHGFNNYLFYDKSINEDIDRNA